MSWILGFRGLANETITRKLRKICKSSNERFWDDRLIILAGEKNTYSGNIADEPDSGFIVSGVGLQHNGKSFSILSDSGWKEQVTNSLPPPEGHYIIIKWDESKISFYADAAGIRDIYISPYENGFIFSTRLDWISCIKGNSIDFNAFGSRWLLINQLSSNSILNNTIRVVQGNKTTISGNDLSFSDSTVKDNSYPVFCVEEFDKTMRKLLLAPFESGFGTSLSLSGGFDSRFILSVILKADIPDLTLHSFGDPSHPDSIVAKRIGKLYNLRHKQYTLPEDHTFSVDELVDFAGQSQMGHPVSAIRQLDNYRFLQEHDAVAVDGGFGEIWRREFLNRLLYRGNLHLKSRDPKAVLPYFSYPKADIFVPEINKIMEEGCLNDIEFLFNKRDDYNSDEDFIDSIARNFRLMNYYGQEQARVDNYITSFMPFAQQILLKNLLSIPPPERKNGKMLKKLIAENARELIKFPLVKGNVTIPYGYPTIINRIYSIIKSRLNFSKNGNSVVKFIQNHLPLIEDLINSRACKECVFYDREKILLLFKRFKSGDYSAAEQLNWWLTFELFRNSSD